MRGFLKLLLCGCRYVCVLCVHALRLLITTYLREVKPEKLVKQVVLLSGFYILTPAIDLFLGRGICNEMYIL